MYRNEDTELMRRGTVKVSGRCVYFTPESGTVSAIDLRSGKEIGSTDFPDIGEQVAFTVHGTDLIALYTDECMNQEVQYYDARSGMDYMGTAAIYEHSAQWAKHEIFGGKKRGGSRVFSSIKGDGCKTVLGGVNSVYFRNHGVDNVLYGRTHEFASGVLDYDYFDRYYAVHLSDPCDESKSLTQLFSL